MTVSLLPSIVASPATPLLKSFGEPSLVPQVGGDSFSSSPLTSLTLNPPTGWRRAAKTTGAALVGAAMLGVPAAIGCYGGALGVLATTVACAAIGYACGKHDGKAEKYVATLFGTLGLLGSAGGALGGTTGLAVVIGVGALLGLAGDAVNRGTKPGY